MPKRNISKQKINKEIYKFQNSYIFIDVETHLKSMQRMLLISKTKIKLTNIENMLFKTDEEIIKYISDIIKQHYKTNSGKIFHNNGKVLGKIKKYEFYLDEKKLTFDINGNLLKD
jgi:hypothetical protein